MTVPAMAVTSRIDHVHGISIHVDIDNTTKSMALHGQLSSSNGIHDPNEKKNTLKSSIVYPSCICPYFSSGSGGHKRTAAGSVAMMQYSSKDGYITNPCWTQAGLDLLSKGVSSALLNNQVEPFASVSSADVVFAVTLEFSILHTRNHYIHADFQEYNKEVQIFQDSYYESNFTMHGLHLKPTNSLYHSTSAGSSKAYKLLYAVEWQSCFPGGALFFTCLPCPPTMLEARQGQILANKSHESVTS